VGALKQMTAKAAAKILLTMVVSVGAGTVAAPAAFGVDTMAAAGDADSMACVAFTGFAAHNRTVTSLC
jgi:hypothetical protein